MAGNIVSPLPPGRWIDFLELYVVITVGRRKSTFKLRVRPPTLAPNQFAYKLKIPIDKELWEDRITEVETPEVVPPKLPKPEISTLVEKSTGQRVLDRMKGVR